MQHIALTQETTFYFVRHGETEHNRRGIVQGRGVDPALNATGRAQAEALARRLAGVPFDVMYASPLRRAMETAEAISRVHDALPFRTLDDLEEMAWGVYEGAPSSPQMRQTFEGYLARWRRGEFAFRIEGGESILDVQQRGLRAVDYLLKRHAGQTLLVVTHGRFLRVLLATLLDEYRLEQMHEIHHANTAVNHLTWRRGRFEARQLNSTTHLETVAFSEAL